MVGLIWFVQIVHYPLLAAVGTDQFPRYEAQHQQLTTYVVMPVMLLELATAIALIPYSRSGNKLLPWIGLTLLLVIWVSTWALQVPAHNALASAFSAEHHQRLVLTNWVRTIAWTGRGAILILLVSRRL
jgi:hypothetical protein